MRNTLPLVLLCGTWSVACAQTPSCNDVPIAYNPSSVIFQGADGSFGDSVITFDITNMHPDQSFAYPQAKLVPLTPLPPGMVMNTHWYTFASSWNPGVTMPANFYFDVNTPIPPDYSVTFEVWGYNLVPTLTDSCRFDSTFTLNLNPGSTGMQALAGERSVRVWPSPAADLLNITLSQGASGRSRISVTNSTGAEVFVRSAASGNLALDISSWAPGSYVVLVTRPGTAPVRQRITVAR